ncbi:MAG: hypothetical protein H6673_15940 [Anaerolineales bacterium]|nr:hypothetical protein [Anaerolineales bacterium]
MLTLTDVWPHIEALNAAPAPYYMDAFRQAMESTHLAGVRLGLLLHAYQMQPISAVRLCEHLPYYAPQPFADGFAQLATHGFLSSPDGETYHLTKQGHQALITIFDAVKGALHEAEVKLDPADLETLAGLLKRLDHAILTTQTVTDLALYGMQRQVVNGQVDSVLSDITDYVANLAAFRCDAHRQTWQRYGVTGPAWEALTVIWRGEANTAATIAEHRLNARPTRGYHDYTSYLAELAGRGWVTSSGETYQLTANGAAIRQASEDETDALFYGVWTVLNATEFQQLDTISQRVCQQLEVD